MRHSLLRRSSLFVVGIALLLGGCGLLSLDENSGQLRQLIENNKEAWEEANIESYRLVYNKTIGAAELDSIRVTVLDGEIDSVSMDGMSVDDPDSFLTIDRLYDEILNNFQRDDRGRFQVQFNEEYSYPKRYRMSPGEQTRGRGVVVTNFAVLNGPNSKAQPQRVARRDP